MTSIALSTSSLQRKLDRLPNPSHILRDKRAAIDIFHKVARQSDIYAAMQNYRDTLSAMSITVNDTFFAEMIQHIDLRSFIRAALAAREYGYAVMEITEYATLNGQTIPGQIELCPPELFGFDSDRRLRLYGTNPNGVVVEDRFPNKFILLQNEPTLTNPYGTGLLDIAYWLAVGLSGNYEFLMVFAEEDGRDKWVGTYPQDATEAQKTELMDALLRLRNGGAATKPEGMSIEPKDLRTRTSSGVLYKLIDEMLLRKISRLWFGTDLLMQVEGKGGYSSSQSGIEIKEDAINSGKYIVKTALQALFALTRRINGKGEERIAIDISRPKTLDKSAAEIDQIYSAMGMQPTEELLIKRGYEKTDFTLATPPKEAPADQQQDFAAEDNLGDIFDIFTKKKASTPPTTSS